MESLDPEIVRSVIHDLMLGGYSKYLMKFVGTCKTLHFLESRHIECSGICITHYVDYPVCYDCPYEANYDTTISKFTNTDFIQCHKCESISKGQWFRNYRKLERKQCRSCGENNRSCQKLNDRYICSSCWHCMRCYSRKNLLVNKMLAKRSIIVLICYNCHSRKNGWW